MTHLGDEKSCKLKNLSHHSKESKTDKLLQTPVSKWKQFFVCFSMKNNIQSIGKLPNTNRSLPSSDSSNSDIKVIHGLRTLTMIWIIFGHTIGLVSPEMMSKYNRCCRYCCCCCSFYNFFSCYRIRGYSLIL